MADQFPGPHLPELGWVLAAAAAIGAIGKIISDWGIAQTTRLKLEAEKRAAEAAREAASAARESSVAERETQIALGAQAYDELRTAQLHGVAELFKEMRLALDDLKAQLQEERDQGRRFRGAVLHFLAVLENVVPELPSPQRIRIQEALAALRQHDGWER